MCARIWLFYILSYTCSVFPLHDFSTIISSNGFKNLDLLNNHYIIFSCSYVPRRRIEREVVA